MRGHDSTQPENALAASEAWWTGHAGLTINRRSRPAPGSAQVAQLVEHATENRSVGGSIPPLGTIAIKARQQSGGDRLAPASKF